MSVEAKIAILEQDTIDKVSLVILGGLKSRGVIESIQLQTQTNLDFRVGALKAAQDVVSEIVASKEGRLKPDELSYEQAQLGLIEAASELQSASQEIAKERDFSGPGKWVNVLGRIRVVWGNPDFHPPFLLRWLKTFGVSENPSLAPYLKTQAEMQEETKRLELALNQAAEEAQRTWGAPLERANQSYRTTQNRLISYWEEQVTYTLSETTDYVRILPQRASEVALKYAKVHAEDAAEFRFFNTFANTLSARVENTQYKRMLQAYTAHGEINDTVYKRLPDATKHQWEEFITEKLIADWTKTGII